MLFSPIAVRSRLPRHCAPSAPPTRRTPPMGVNLWFISEARTWPIGRSCQHKVSTSRRWRSRPSRSVALRRKTCCGSTMRPPHRISRRNNGCSYHCQTNGILGAHKLIQRPVNAEADLAILDQIRVASDFPQMSNNGRSPQAHIGSDPDHAQPLDPPFACQLGVVDDISLPNQGVKLVTAQSACFE